MRKKSIQIILEEKKLVIRKQEEVIKEQTNKLVNNYFDSFEGKIFLFNNEIKPFLNAKSKEN